MCSQDISKENSNIEKFGNLSKEDFEAIASGEPYVLIVDAKKREFLIKGGGIGIYFNGKNGKGGCILPIGELIKIMERFVVEGMDAKDIRVSSWGSDYRKH